MQIAKQTDFKSTEQYYRERKQTADAPDDAQERPIFEVLTSDQLQDEFDIQQHIHKNMKLRLDAFINDSLQRVNEDNLKQLRNFKGEREYFEQVKDICLKYTDDLNF